MLALKLHTDIPPLDRFPEYCDTFVSPTEIETMSSTPSGLATHRAIGKLQQEGDISRHPSPQPTHVSVPLSRNNGNGHRILRSATVGYIAPEFSGKVDQMKQGLCYCVPATGASVVS
jgi:glutamate dehydrogenase